jgi:hypothetical protein
MISMPIINRAIPSNMPTRAAPITGDAIITKANTIAITPAAILNILDQLRLVLSAIPWITLAIPSISKAIASNIIKNAVVPTGNDRTIIDNIITIIPRPMLPQRDLLGINIPLKTFSIPTINKIIATILTNKTTDNAGEASTNIDIITAITPRPICAARSQPGDLGSEREEEDT